MSNAVAKKLAYWFESKSRCCQNTSHIICQKFSSMSCNDGTGFTQMSNLVKQSRYKKFGKKDIICALLYFKQFSVI